MSRSAVEHARDHLHAALDRASCPAITCSFQPGGLAVLHLLGDRRTDIQVLFVDTGYHFQETLEFKDEMTRLWGLEVRSVTAAQTTHLQQQHVGPLYRTNPDQCCEDRKTGPLFAALEAHDLWITGLRKEQSDSRRGTQGVERRILRSGRVLTKVNPIAQWTADELWTYTMINEIPVHPLVDQGYPSIGCAPCTSRAPDGSRSGRWAGVKIECGLHTTLDG